MAKKVLYLASSIYLKPIEYSIHIRIYNMHIFTQRQPDTLIKSQSTHIHTCTHTHAHTRTHSHMYMHTHIHTHTTHMQILVNIYTH